MCIPISDSLAIHKIHATPNDWKWNNKILIEAYESIEDNIEIDRTYNIPYLAGYNVKGTKIYIDKDMPTGFEYKGIWLPTDRFLVVHEAVEKSILKLLGFPYQYAHQIALHNEWMAVTSEGIDWDPYNAFMMKWVKKIEDIEAGTVPLDLDLTPYIDENDYTNVDKIRALMSEGK